jgi:AraC-like DNA-binding protein
MNNVELLFDKLQITANVFHNGQYCGNWQVDTVGSGFINFHAITHGQCFLHQPDGSVIVLNKGDVVLLPLDSPHFLSPNRHDTKRKSSIVSEPIGKDLPEQSTVLLCGYFEYQHPLMHVIAKELPEYWIITKGSDGSDVLHESMQLLISASLEASDTVVTASIILNKIAEITFLLIIKHLMVAFSSTAGAMFHPAIANSLEALHSSPEKNWSIDKLATIANMSKSNYAAKFKDFAGITPMKYLTQWRLRCASNDLKSTAAPIITIANKYGYESEASFSKAFKREMGVSPSKHR